MSDLIIKAIVTGFILSIMIGPSFFVLLETSIRRGVKAAIAFDVGVLLSDVLYILIAFVFYSEVLSLTRDGSEHYLKIVGGIVFLIYGAINWFKKPKENTISSEIDIQNTNRADYAMLTLKGFLLNIANPLIIFYWFSVMTLASKQSNGSGVQKTSVILFILLVLVVFFAIDFLKIIGAKKLRPLITEKLLFALNRIICIVFLVFGVVLVLQGIMKV